MDLNSAREPALLGIPEERHIAVSPPKRPFAYHEFFLPQAGGIERRSFRHKQLAGDVFYVRDYGPCDVSGDRGLAYAAGALVRESRYLNKVRELVRAEPGHPLDVTRQAVVCVNRPWRNYYHWLLQCLFTIWLLERHDPREDRVFMLPAGAERRAAMLPLLGVAPERIGYFPGKEMYALPDVAFTNAIRTSVTPMFVPFRDALLEQAGIRRVAPPGQGRTLYISRRDSPKRKWTAEPELEAALQARGVEIVVASELSFVEQMQTFIECDLLIAPHGAGLTNMLFMTPGTRVVEVKPSYQQNHAFIALARVCGLRFALIRPDTPEIEGRVWSAEAAAILRLLDDPGLFAEA